MEYRRFGNNIVARIDRGEEILENLQKICEMENVKLANVNALGALSEFEVGLFDVDEKKYYSQKHAGAFEIVSLTGSVTTKEGKIYMHIHLSAGDRENKVYGGHLNSAVVSATCEGVGLNLFKFE